MTRPMTDEPAFPATEANGLNSGVSGMSLRDYFAAKAMQGLIASASGDVTVTPKLCAEWSFFMADEMMKARLL